MSLLSHCLKIFGFSVIDDVTEVSLKKAFKLAILSAHPDKKNLELESESESVEQYDIDDIMNSYVYLSETLQRIFGGRSTLQNMVSPDELKNGRGNEIINKVFEEFDNEEFNRLFEITYIRFDQQGYESWLKADATAEDNYKIPPPTFTTDELNTVFLKHVKEGKAEPTSIILHPDEMALNSGKNLGVSLIQETGGTFTSGSEAKPEYTDLYSAFTFDNTISDKIPTYVETIKTLDTILTEREAEIVPTATDLEHIVAWETRRIEEAKQLQELVKAAAASSPSNCIINIIGNGESDYKRGNERENEWNKRSSKRDNKNSATSCDNFAIIID